MKVLRMRFVDRYRYQLEAFVDKVRGRTPQYWPSREDSVNQMRLIDQIYEKASASRLSQPICIVLTSIA